MNVPEIMLELARGGLLGVQLDGSVRRFTVEAARDGTYRTANGLRLVVREGRAGRLQVRGTPLHYATSP